MCRSTRPHHWRANLAGTQVAHVPLWPTLPTLRSSLRQVPSVAGRSLRSVLHIHNAPCLHQKRRHQSLHVREETEKRRKHNPTLRATASVPAPASAALALRLQLPLLLLLLLLVLGRLQRWGLFGGCNGWFKFVRARTFRVLDVLSVASDPPLFSTLSSATFPHYGIKNDFGNGQKRL